ncbi:glutamyl-tRNA(Gln) amidotransferase subunit B, mitochondrial isoform X2 [Sitophilus oryzae]|uniref:Glutamyl-tRNA(Gln) amidotransferase subunit B, mitochondrial n=1 Tax=Sitophilus oryzae TaxID=7048 RepID=A0A6J2Y3Y8_SITOR|nr:glutamyl-tRNA(Gln) amidotransferase subunit B, mitochondrial isoform X1 [Sitophilus oryzae]XP_030757716.1 glutamyl-tRNA(Gln) amidotransferase subunit B, mitochondrial isoform X2 [Sitophilus oryzae]
MFSRSTSYISKRLYSKSVQENSKWRSVVGLEVHAQIQSNSKLFSGAGSKFSSPINSNVSLFDMATPGTLPTLNKSCVEAAVLTALALNCQVNPVSYFDRKHYFYADMPAGYQITQQRAPLASNGSFDFNVYTPSVHKKPYKTKVRIKQIQLEQDSGKSLHDFDRSLVDLNRAGMPLMELVFEPDLKDGDEAAALIKELIGIFERIRTCSCKMEEGALRIDANVSIHEKGQPLGTRTEIKNIGSVRGVAGAIKYEIDRQIKIKNSFGTVLNETRAWNAEKKVTVPMRDKEVQQDYRYMPEPNLPPLHVAMGPIEFGSVNADTIKKIIPELPEEIRIRLRNELGLTETQSIILVNDSCLLQHFELALKSKNVDPIALANFLINDLNTSLNKLKLEIENMNIPSKYFSEIIDLLKQAQISHQTARLVLDELLSGDSDTPAMIIEKRNWKQITDVDELTKICETVLKENEKALKDFLSGKKKVFKFFLGAVAKTTDNRANMGKCDEILKTLLSKRLK